MKTLTTSQLLEVSGGKYYPGKFLEMGISTGMVSGGILAFTKGCEALLIGSTGSNEYAMIESLGACMAAGLILGLGMGFYQEYQIEKIGHDNARMVEYV